jgi:hypothetical protein
MMTAERIRAVVNPLPPGGFRRRSRTYNARIYRVFFSATELRLIEKRRKANKR